MRFFLNIDQHRFLNELKYFFNCRGNFFFNDVCLKGMSKEISRYVRRKYRKIVKTFLNVLNKSNMLSST